jgi:hypothetical protein
VNSKPRTAPRTTSARAGKDFAHATPASIELAKERREMKKHKKSETALTFNATTLKRMDMAEATGGMKNGGGGGSGVVTGIVCTFSCGCCYTAYTAAQACCFTC